MNILIVKGHPRAGSFSDAIVEAFAEEASRACAPTEILTLRELNFDYDVLAVVGDLSQPVEPDIERARELLLWCEHLVPMRPGCTTRKYLPNWQWRFARESQFRSESIR